MSSARGEPPVPCPDPSAHPEVVSQHESANTAAQLAAADSGGIQALGPDGKLSAAGAATSLKYANAKDLPSFPSVGIDTATSGNKAATLAASSQKSIEMWKPDASSSASKAALLAARDGGKLDLWQYKSDGTGNTAATAAMGKNSSPQLDYGYTTDGRQKALLAATKSLSVRDRPVSSDSVSPERYPDQSNAGFNALNAATVAGRPSSKASTDAARIQNMHGVSREMYTERPPVALEVEEQRHREALRASAVVMANQLYNLERADVERSVTNPGSVAAERVGSQSFNAATTSLEGDTLRMQAMNYVKVQEAAQKLAAERLAKLDPDGVLAYKEHYGYGRSPQKSKLSLRGGRPKSEETTASRDLDSSDDEVQAGKIKSQMSHLNDQVAGVDAKKRTQDREALMAAAERNVHARMHTMDEKVFAETGKIPPSMLEEWESKAKAKAAADSEARMENHGKVHIGGGKFMDQSEVEAIAAARMQPTLDEINDEAERRRAHEEAVKLDLERHKERVETEKQRDREVKAEMKRVNDEEKEKQRQEKAAEKEKARQEKEAERLRLKEEKQQQDLEKRIAKMEEKQQKQAQKEDKAWKDQQQKLEEERVRKANMREAQERALDQKIKKVEAETAATAPETTEKETGADTTATATATDTVAEGTEAKQESGGLLGFLHSKKVLDPRDPVEPGTTVATDDATPIDTGATDGATREAATSTAVPETSTATATGDETENRGRRDSRVKSLLGKLKRSSKTNTESEDTTAEPSLSEKAKGKQRASIDSVSSVDEEDGDKERASADVFEEARDRFDTEPEPPQSSVTKETATGSPTRTGSKFQEEL